MAPRVKEKYRTSDGAICPGVTTITGELGWNKGQLISWANKLGLKGVESRQYVDDKAAIGTLAHSLVLSEYRGEPFDTKDYTANQIEQAKSCLASYKEWSSGKKVAPILVEERLVSEEHRYGGTPDFYGTVDGVLTLVDYKTGKGIYPEYIIQVAAYVQLIHEKNWSIDKTFILNIPRAKDESFSVKPITPEVLKAGWEIFKHLLAIWNLKNAVAGE